MDADALTGVIAKVRAMTSRQEKIEAVIIALCATLSSILEVAAALSIAVFVQIINNPARIFTYIHNHFGFDLPFSTPQLMVFGCIGCAVVYLIKNLFSGWEVYYQSKCVQRMSYRFRANLLREYSNYCYQRYLALGAVKHLQIFSTDIDLMFTNGVSPMAACFSELMVMIFLVGFMFYMNPTIACGVVLLTGSVVFFFFRYLMPLFYRIGSDLQAVAIERSRVLHHFFYGFKEVVLRGTNDAFIDEYGVHDSKHIRMVTRQTTYQAIPRLVLECIFMLTFVGVVWGMVMMQQSADNIVAILGTYLYIGFRLMPGVNRVIGLFGQIKIATPSICRVYDQFSLLNAKSAYEDIPSFHFHESIEVKNACFSYDQTHLAMDNVNLTIRKGESLGIIGKTGSGKSTLIDVLLGINALDSGEVLIDGTFPARCRQWHIKMGFVPQSVFLIDDSIAENVTFGSEPGEASQERLNEVIDQCDLRHVVERLSDEQGRPTSVGDRGMFLSGGERQRVAIARALYPGPEVLVFDEATSSLDQDTEDLIISNIQRSYADLTIIMVAHRLTTLVHCDHVIKIQAGKIVAEGSYEELCL